MRIAIFENIMTPGGHDVDCLCPFFTIVSQIVRSMYAQ